MIRLCALAAVVALVAAAAPAAADTAPPSGNAKRGKQLHAEHCLGCHDSRIYTRENRMVNSMSGLVKQVELCHRQVGKELTRAQVNDLIAYLNETYYRFE